jgi:hypothetical protein
MDLLVTVFLLISISFCFAVVLTNRIGREYVIFVTALAWLVLSPLVIALNDWIPFASGGDDEAYYHIADPPVRSLREATDLNRFAGYYEQPGFPLLLSLINSFTGHNLVAYKLLNLLFFILLSLVWYRIGCELQGRSFAEKMMAVVLLVTPLWNYVFFLLKDISITLLQSVFILTVIKLVAKPRFLVVFISLVSTYLLLLFRSPLVVQNMVVLIGSLVGVILFERRSKNQIQSVVFGFIILIIGVLFATNADVLSISGIESEQRLIGSQAFVEAGLIISQSSEMNRKVFPVIYLFTETAGLSPSTWESYDDLWIRGILAVPWILFIVPFVPIGFVKLIKYFRAEKGAQYSHHKEERQNINISLWIVPLIFIASSVFISWTVGDTTRWRIPDLPMIAAIALFGWNQTAAKSRLKVISYWSIGMVVASCTYYIIRSI